jgi:hypothetical protein
MLIRAAIFSLLLVLPVAAEAESPLVDVDFPHSSNEVHIKEKGSFDGVLPQGGMVDSPYWNSSIASSKVLSENGKDFLRIHVEKFGDSVQFSWPVQDLKAPGCYKLSVVFRSGSGNLALLLRQMPPPYESIWSEKANAESPGTWCERTYTFRIEQGSAVPIGLFFILRQAGDYDLASLKLSRLTPDEFYATIRRPDKGTTNFFRNSRLPLGLQAGWNLSREFEEGSVEADPTERGPSGYFPLKLQSTRKIALFSEPFQTSDPLQKNSLSLAFKGSGQWRVAIMDENLRELASRTLVPSRDWKTETIEFTLDEQARASRALAFRIAGTGTISLDCFQAWAGTGPRAYTSQGECEVALALPESDISETRIQFSDTLPEIRYLASGNLTGATLKMKAFDAFGQGKELPAINLGRQPASDSGKEEAGRAGFDVFPNAMLGQFRIEAWIERDGKRISPFNEILVTRIRRPIHFTEDAPGSPFGAHFMASPLIIKMMKAAGVNWARLHDAGTDYIGWYHLESQKGVWTFHDEELNRYRTNHIKIFAGLQTAPTWASFYADSGKKDLDSYADRYFQPKDIDAWSNYVRTVTARYKGVIDDYFIWNEPWGASFWHTGYDPEKKVYLAGPHPEADYARLSIAAYKAAKEGNPSAQIAGFNTTIGDTGQEWTKGVFDGGAYDACDVVDYHFYTEEDQAMSGDQAQKGFNEAIGYIKEKVPSFAKPVYMSEGQSTSLGSSGGAGSGLYNHTLTWDASSEKPVREADKTCRFVVANLAAGASKVFLYTAHGYEGLVQRPNISVLVGPDGYPHVELAAFSNLAWHLEDKKFIMDEPMGENGCAYIFEGKGGSTAVLSGRRNGNYPIPASPDFKVSDLFGNAVEGQAGFKGFLLYVDSPLPAETLAGVLTKKQR